MVSTNGHSNGSEANTYPLLISNKEHKTTNSFPVYSPATGSLVHNYSSASIEDTDAAITAAQAAYPAWKALAPGKKRDIFLKAAEIMDSRQEELTKYMVDETGAAPGVSSHFFVPLELPI